MYETELNYRKEYNQNESIREALQLLCENAADNWLADEGDFKAIMYCDCDPEGWQQPEEEPTPKLLREAAYALCLEQPKERQPLPETGVGYCFASSFSNE